MAECRVLRSRKIVNKRVATRGAMANEQALRTRSPLPNEQALRTRGAMANRQAQLTRGPMPIWDHSTPDHASLEHQNRVRFLTDSEGEQPNCLWQSRRPSQFILTCGFAARNWGSTRAKPDWLLTFAIPLFMRLKSGEKRSPAGKMPTGLVVQTLFAGIEVTSSCGSRSRQQRCRQRRQRQTRWGASRCWCHPSGEAASRAARARWA